MTPAFWRGKRVFLTGHTGFKGSWLTLWLSSMGAVVRGYALAPPTNPSLFELSGAGEVCESVIADLRDAARLDRELVAFQPDIVIHMAAQPLVRLSYREPVETFSTNVLGAVHLFEAARKSSTVRVIVNVTSDKCYENREWVWGYRENDPMGGSDPYSASKGCAELVTTSYARSFFSTPGGTVLGSGRAGNVIGGGDWAEDRLIPDIIRAFGEGREVEIRRPDSVRPWQHVLEPLSGYLLLAERLWQGGHAFAGGWNFGPSPDAVQPVRTIADRIVTIWQEPRRWIDRSNPADVHEARLLQLDSTKARVDLGWSPRWRFDEALTATVDWYQKQRAGASARELCLQQIAEFQRAA